MSKEEYIEVTLTLPQKVVDFLKDMEKTLDMTMKEYLEYSILQAVGADLDTYDTFVPTVTEILEKYGLAEFLKDSMVGPECEEILAAKVKA